ncbi:hypothetical protein ACU4GD_22890 [Cupriavidus basilensis]
MSLLCAQASVGLQGTSLANADSVMAVCQALRAIRSCGRRARSSNTVDMSPESACSRIICRRTGPARRRRRRRGHDCAEFNQRRAGHVQQVAAEGPVAQDLGVQGHHRSDHGGDRRARRRMACAKDGREAARLAIQAGVDMSMHDSAYLAHLAGLVKSGEVSDA